MKHREIESIAFDLAQQLGIYKDSYSGSPFKTKAEEVLAEYMEYQAYSKGLRTQKIDDWDRLESRLVTLLHDDNKELSELVEKAKEIVETVKCLLLSGNLKEDSLSSQLGGVSRGYSLGEKEGFLEGCRFMIKNIRDTSSRLERFEGQIESLDAREVLNNLAGGFELALESDFPKGALS